MATCSEAAVTAGGTVTFACGPAPVTIAANTMVLDGVNTIIQGGGLVTIDGEDLVPTLHCEWQCKPHTLRPDIARATGGGCAIHNSGTLYIRRSTLQDNTAESSNNGGAILNHGGVLTIEQSTLQSNTATSGGNGGAIAVTGGVVAVRQSTFNGNYATGRRRILHKRRQSLSGKQHR